MDEQVGRLRAELKKLGVDENTMLWFCSDNGPARQGSPRHVGSTGGLSGYKLSIQEGVWMEDQYKLVLSGETPLLYDIPKDPAEKTDLPEALPDVTARMKSGLTEWKNSVMEELKLVTR